jgi:hypothetical protein
MADPMHHRLDTRTAIADHDPEEGELKAAFDGQGYQTIAKSCRISSGYAAQRTPIQPNHDW